MYGGSGKLGRGGGGGRGGAGPVKRSVQSTFHRPSTAPAGRLSASGSAAPRNRNNTAAQSTSTPSIAEESFSLVTGNPLNYAMIIKLAPDLVEEIKRVESQGSAARIKFDAHPTNPSGNVIDVGGKEFRFTWAQEKQDLVDIYEERQSGDDGNGLLVESGAAWRKVNVQRVLDESTKNHVKMQSEEAKRKQKSRRAIILDHGNPSMKNQMKAVAAVEVNQWRHKQKSEPPKKRKADTLSVGGPPKSVNKSGLASSGPPKVRPSTSPLLSTPEQSRGTLKALERAIGDSVPNSVRQIEPVPEKIADVNPPGRYFLKPGVELDGFKKPSPQNGSSPEDNHQQALAPRNNFDQVSTQEPSFPSKHDIKKIEVQEQMKSRPVEEFNPLEKIGTQHGSPDLFGERKVSEDRDGLPGSSSSSGSDSDSDSDNSDSSSESGSASKSKSCSDSESDASSNSKEGSDEDVDIMSDDDKELKQKSEQFQHDLLTFPWRAPEGGLVQNVVDEKHDGHDSDLVEIEKDLPEDELDAEIDVVDDSFPNMGGEKPHEETMITSPGFHVHQEDGVHTEKLDGERDNLAKNRSKNEQFDGSERISKSKSKRGSNGKNFDDDNPIPTKRSKADSLNLPQFFSWSPHNTTPEGSIERAHKGGMTDRTSRTVMDETKYGSIKGQNLEVPSKSISDNVNEVREDVHTNEKRPPKDSRLGSAGEKHSYSYYRENTELTGKFKGTGPSSNSQLKNSPRDNNRVDVDKFPVTKNRGSKLRRELSDLELGELREPLPEEASAFKNQIERRSSSKQSENISSSDYWNIGPYKGKPAGRTKTDSSQVSTPRSNIGISSNPEALSKKRTPEPYAGDSTRPQHKSLHSQDQQMSRIEHVELGFQNNKVVEWSSKVRHNEQGNGVEGNGGIQRKGPVGAGQGAARILAKDDKRQKSSLTDTNEKRKDMSLSESKDGVLKKRRGSSLNEDTDSYSKYEKEAAELKGPIKDFSQYEEYVQEYREKYDCYRSLSTILESHRSEFLKLGRDLELAKGRNKDQYSMISRKIIDSYRLYGTKHRRLKKIFVVLHEELQNLKQMIKDYAISLNKD